MARFILDPFKFVRGSGDIGLTDDARVKLNAGAWILGPGGQNSVDIPSATDGAASATLITPTTRTASESLPVSTAVASGSYMSFTVITEAKTVSLLTPIGAIPTGDTVDLTTATAAVDTPADTVTVTSGVPITPTLPAAIMALTPAGYWKMDEGTGTTATDSSGNARHGTYTAPTWTSGGIRDNKTYATFAGSTSRMEVPDNNAWTPSVGAISVFFIIANSQVAETTPKFWVGRYLSGQYEWLFFTQNFVPRATTYTLAGAVVVAQLCDQVPANYVKPEASAYVLTISDATTAATVRMYRNNNTALQSNATIGAGTGGNGTATLKFGNTDANNAPNGAVMAHAAIFPGVLSGANITSLMSAAAADGWI